jgi:hypothetical protein
LLGLHGQHHDVGAGGGFVVVGAGEHPERAEALAAARVGVADANRARIPAARDDAPDHAAGHVAAADEGDVAAGHPRLPVMR